MARRTRCNEAENGPHPSKFGLTDARAHERRFLAELRVTCRYQTRKATAVRGGFSVCAIHAQIGSGMPVRQLDRSSLDQRLDGAQSLQHLARYRRIHLYHGQRLHRFGSAALAAQGKVGDVDAVLAEDGTDLADDAGHVEVAADEEIALKRSLDVDTIKLQQARLLAM